MNSIHKVRMDTILPTGVKAAHHPKKLAEKCQKFIKVLTEERIPKKPKREYLRHRKVEFFRKNIGRKFQKRDEEITQ